MILPSVPTVWPVAVAFAMAVHFWNVSDEAFQYNRHNAVKFAPCGRLWAFTVILSPGLSCDPTIESESPTILVAFDMTSIDG